MKLKELKSDEIQELLIELYNRAYKKGYENNKNQLSENCKTDTREGVIISDGGDVNDVNDYVDVQLSNQEKMEVVEYIQTKLFDLLNDEL
ncbi:hypothetical protein OBJ94_06570 [Empedobacter falsenii]